MELSKKVAILERQVVGAKRGRPSNKTIDEQRQELQEKIKRNEERIAKLQEQTKELVERLQTKPQSNDIEVARLMLIEELSNPNPDVEKIRQLNARLGYSVGKMKSEYIGKQIPVRGRPRKS